MSSDEMLDRASLVFVGVIQEQLYERWPSFRLVLPQANSQDRQYWRVLRRKVRVETVLRGTEPHDIIDLYEVFWVGGASGSWNGTEVGDRDLFLLNKERGLYRVVRDWRRSIFPITTGPHERLPLDDSHSLWERIALMNFSIPASAREKITYPYFSYIDPGWRLNQWRKVKLWRGLARHPSRAVRIPACRALLLMSWGQDECWDSLSDEDRGHFYDSGFTCCSAADVENARRDFKSRSAGFWWEHAEEREMRRLLTASSDAELRTESCRRWERQYPDDHDNGCPANRPPPATIVTQNGDVPLIGDWPRE
jgi:hypothetical protein